MVREYSGLVTQWEERKQMKLERQLDGKPPGSRPRGGLKKRWMDWVRQDLERLEVTDWEEWITGSRLLEVDDSGSQNSCRVVKAHKCLRSIYISFIYFVLTYFYLNL